MRYRAPEGLGELQEQPLRSPEVAEWRAIGTFGIVGALCARGKSSNGTVIAETNSNCNSSAATVSVLQKS